MTIDPVSLAITVALTAAQMAMQASKKIEGPRLDDLNVTVADYGTPLNYFYGIRRFEGVPIIWAEPVREVKRRRKTKGGKFNDYTYYGTWAVAIADHEIEGVTRIWFDKHLIYDATAAGPPTPFSLGTSFDLTTAIRIYTGTETQETDPRMLATVEAEHGAGSCPAYRGVAYIVFEDIPLEKIGNRIPQITVEAVTAADPVYPHESVPSHGAVQRVALSPDRSRALVADGDVFYFWDLASRAEILSVTQAFDLGGFRFYPAIANDGRIYYTSNTGAFLEDSLIVADADGLGALIALDLDNKSSDVQLIIAGDDVERVYCLPYANFETVQIYTIGGLSGLFTDDLGFTASQVILDAYGDVWALGAAYAAASVANLTRVTNTSGRAVGSVQTFACTKGVGVATYQGCHNATEAHFFIIAGGDWYTIDDTTFAIKDSGTFPTGDTHLRFALPTDDSIFVIGNFTSKEISTRDGSVLRTFTMLDWLAEDTDSGFYDPVNKAFVSKPQFDEWFTWRYLDRIGSAGTTLGDIVEDVAERCALASADVDAGELDQEVAGYSWTQGSGKDIISPLLDLHDSDARPHNFQIEFIKRGSAALGTLAVADFVRSGEEPRYSVKIAQDTDLPRSITLAFADPAGDQQTNTVRAQRPLDSIDGVRELSVDMTTLVLDVDTARQLAERYFRRVWNERESFVLSLTPQKLALEPGDVYGLTLDDVSRTARNTKITITGKENVLRTEWQRDLPRLAELTTLTGATFDGRVPQTVVVPLLSKGFILDIPLLRDADNDTNPILYYGAGPYAAGTWPGALIMRSDDGTDYEDEVGSIAAAAAIVWGFSTGALAEASPAVWDRGNEVNITLNNGALTSTTEAACDISPTLNLALLGNELIQFTTATLELDGSYTLSGLKRGRRGTEWAIAGHGTAERFVLLDAVGNVEMGASDVGDTLYFKAVTSGRDADGAFPITIAPYTGASLMPYAPAHLAAAKDSVTGDWTFSWIRRSRIGASWIGGTTVPLGETTEEYDLDILDGMGAVVRTITVSSEGATYPEADQVTDGGDVPVGSLDVALYQISSVVDRGFAAEASF